MKTELHENTIDKLRELILLNLDSFEGCQKAAREIDDGELRHRDIATYLRDLGQERRQQAGMIQGCVKLAGASPDRPTVPGSRLPYWSRLKDALEEGDPYDVLIAAERGEEKIKKKYEIVLLETAGSPFNAILQRHYVATQEALEDIREMLETRETRDA